MSIKFFFAALFSVFCSINLADAAFVKGAVTSGTGGSGTFTLVATFTPTTAGDTILVLANSQTSAIASSTFLTSITDNAAGGSSTYVQPSSNFANQSAAPFSGTWIIYCQSVKAGVTTLTANFATGGVAMTFNSVLILEYSSLGLFDVIGAMTAQSSGSTRTSGAATLAAGDTAIGVIIDWDNPSITAVSSPSATFDYRDTTPATYASSSGILSGSQSASFTTSNTADRTMTTLLGFKVPVSGAVSHLRLLKDVSQ